MSAPSKIIFIAITAIAFATLLNSCGGKEELPVVKYYEYDHGMPLMDSVRQIQDTTGYKLYYVTFNSVHDQKVTALLSLPNMGNEPFPVVILMHGYGDRKTVDYIEAGNKIMLDNGLAVLRLDLYNHGDRVIRDFDFSFTNPDTKYRTRDVIIQSVFDLRRAVDFIETRKELNANRISYFGISLGGITGTIFCGVDKRVKVPIIALAGGGMHLMFGTEALTDETRDYLSMIEPLNFVEHIAPRPLLMLNAEDDEIIPPMMSKLMFRKAKDPKKIVWYPGKHHDLPIEKAYPEGVYWIKEKLGLAR